jgi:hypothetical protein
LAGYRERGGTVDAPVFDLFDAWVREIDPDAVHVVDALFDTILQDYEPEIDGALVTRIPILITQILQRKSIPLTISQFPSFSLGLGLIFAGKTLTSSDVKRPYHNYSASPPSLSV